MSNNFYHSDDPRDPYQDQNEGGSGGGTGDMEKSVYDTNGNNIVDNSEKVEGVDTAGNSQYYGTDGSGTPGFHDLPSGGGGSSLAFSTGADSYTLPIIPSMLATSKVSYGGLISGERSYVYLDEALTAYEVRKVIVLQDFTSLADMMSNETFVDTSQNISATEGSVVLTYTGSRTTDIVSIDGGSGVITVSPGETISGIEMSQLAGTLTTNIDVTDKVMHIVATLQGSASGEIVTTAVMILNYNSILGGYTLCPFSLIPPSPLDSSETYTVALSIAVLEEGAFTGVPVPGVTVDADLRLYLYAQAPLAEIDMPPAITSRSHIMPYPVYDPERTGIVNKAHMSAPLISAYKSGAVGDNEIIHMQIATTAFSIEAGAGTSGAYAEVAATAETTFNLLKNGNIFGTVVVAAAGNTGVITVATSTSFAVGDRLSVQLDGTADSTLADMAITLVSKLN